MPQTIPMPSSAVPPLQFPPGQTLLFDADDTLWENNVLFERAIAGFIELLAHPTLSSEEVRTRFNALEHTRVQVHGYGTRSFRNSMAACLQQLTGRDLPDMHHRRLDELAASIVESPIELLPGVPATLQTLATRHRLMLVTKGEPEEQLRKLERSGLAQHFSATEVLLEKHREAYLDLCARHRLDAAITWMLGNSPKSDINPALAAGLHAVYLPHPNTWVLEHEQLAPAPYGRHCITVDSVSELLRIF